MALRYCLRAHQDVCAERVMATARGRLGGTVTAQGAPEGAIARGEVFHLCTPP